MHVQQPDSIIVTRFSDSLNDQESIQPVDNNAVTQKMQTVPSSNSISGNSAKKDIVKPGPAAKKLIPLTKTDSIKKPKQKTEAYKPFSLYRSIAEKDSSIVELKSETLLNSSASSAKVYTGPQKINTQKNVQKEWVLGITIFSGLLFIILRIYFQKYLSGVVTSIVNIQIAEKLIREKNVIIRRVFALLNLNFVISSSLFIYLTLKKFNIELPISNTFLNYLIIFICLATFLLIRYILIISIGSIFDSLKLFKEYLHNTYLINKNLGLYLLPMVISVFYLKQPFSDITFYFSLALVALSALYKYFRAVQIIMRYNIFLFYTILYLCTLEILPVLVGVKFVLSLR
jgi:hypothetical protein